MDEAGDLKVHVNGHHTLLLHQSVVCTFSGRLRAMVAQEKKRMKTASRGGGGAEVLMAIELAGFPGGADGFELVVRFCYDSGRLPPLRPTDIPLVHCAASFLDMTEEVRAGNLLVQAEAFVDDGLGHWTWADLLTAVKSCDSLFSSCLLDKLLSALFSRIAVGAETLTRSSSSTCSSSSPDTAGGRPSSAARTPESMKPSCLVGGREWWFDDVASLSPASVEKAMRVIGCYGAENKNLTLTRFLLHYLRRAATLRKADDQGCLSGLADTAVHGVELGGGAAAFSCRGLFWALRVASAAGMSRECRRKLERLVGKMLDQATLDDLLVSGDGGGVYDVSLVIRLVRVFVSSVKEEKEATSPSPLSSSSRERMRKVGRLLDKYLAEISPDHGLGVSRFLAVAESLPDSARDCYDGVYRALDIYLEGARPIASIDLLSVVSRTMDEAGDLKVHVNGHHTLLLHQSVVCTFSGRLRAMVAQEKKRMKTASRGGGGAEVLMAIELAGFPGGADGFELVVRFCYDSGRLPPLRPTDIPLVHCAASFLDMTEEVRAGNLLVQAEAFVDDGLGHWTWADLLTAVKSCDSLFSSCLLDKLLSALFSRIAVGAETLTRSSSSTCSSSSPDTAGGRPSSAARTPESMKPSCLVGGREWWFDDVASLSPASVEKAMRVIGCYGAENKNLTLTRFLLHYLRRAATLRKADDQGCLSGLADTAVHGVELGGGAAAFSCRGLFWALRVASAAGMSRECRRKLERLVGKMLDQATLDDLLVSGDGGGVYDVSLVIRLVRVFVSSVKEEKEATSPSPLSSSSRERMRKVGRLLDKYLAEISPDHGLGVSRFLAVAESLPDSARDCYDGVYRALDIYLESHAALTVEERGTLCRCVNYGKLTLEACKDLAKNRRIPPGITVQALSSQRLPKLPNPMSPSRTPRQVVVDEEKAALRVDLQKMKGRVVELETACKEMMGHVKVSRTAANKSLGGRGLPWMC